MRAIIVITLAIAYQPRRVVHATCRGEGQRQLMAILLAHRPSGVATLKAGTAVDVTRLHGFGPMPAVFDSDECVKQLRNGDWVATAQPAVL